MGFYVIAHRVNDTAKLDMALNWGANALEIDITLHSKGYYAWHGMGWIDWNSARMETFLDLLADRLMTGAGRAVSLLIIDLKYTQNERIGPQEINVIRTAVQQRLLNRVNGLNPVAGRGLYALYTIDRTSRDMMVTAMATNGLGDHEGINYDAVAHINSDRTNPRSAARWRANNAVSAFMYSSGISSVTHSARARRYAREAMELSQRDPSRALSTYAWTFNRANNASHWVRDHQHDGIMGNMRRNFGFLATSLDHYGLGDRTLHTRQERPPFLT